ncbi:hypothetical protein L1987_87468 [Smallanthus sonchifolius]|nr:hypothetical protein L1987_87468 [Smallanthus sonchifolius]
MVTSIQKRFLVCAIFGGDGSYMAPYNLHTDTLLIAPQDSAQPACHRLVRTSPFAPPSPPPPYASPSPPPYAPSSPPPNLAGFGPLKTLTDDLWL